jgi:hypothetical protein
MNSPLAEIILAANNMDEEGTFLIQLLVLVVLGAIVAISSLIKTRAKRLKTQQRHRPADVIGATSQQKRRIEAFKRLKDKYVGIFAKTKQAKTPAKEPIFNFQATGTTLSEKQIKEIDKTKKRDISSGMEILELDFLLSIVEKTKGRNKKDVMMRKLVFNELIRRGQLNSVDSKVLNFYIINKGNIYDKHIQCEAMKALAQRTRSRPAHSIC